MQHLKDEPYDSDDDVLKATVMEIVQTMKELVAQNPLYREQMQARKDCAQEWRKKSAIANRIVASRMHGARRFQ